MAFQHESGYSRGVSRALAYDALRVWLEDATKTLRAGGGCFHLRSRCGRRIVCQAVTNAVKSTHLSYGLDLTGCPAIQQVLDSGEPLPIDHAAVDLRVAQVARERFGLKSILYQPVRFGGRPEAVAIFHHRRPHPWSSDEVETSRELARAFESEIASRRLRLHEVIHADLYEAMVAAIPGVLSLVDDQLLTFASSRSVRQDLPLEAQSAALSVDELLADSDRGHELRAALQDIVAGDLGHYEGLFTTANGRWWVHARPTFLNESARPAVTVEARSIATLGVHVQPLPPETPKALLASEERNRLEALGRIAASVAHEVNNALQLIRFTVDEMSAEVEAAERESIRAAAERAAGMTAQLLTFARRAPARLESTDLADFVTRQLSLARRSVGADHAVGLRLTGHPVVRLDARKMGLVIINLCRNAAQASPAGSAVDIEVGLARREGSEWGYLAVLDNGPGMPNEVVENLGQFQRSSKPDGLGAGIGLAVVKQVADEHGGLFIVEPRPEGGCRAAVLLPVEPVARGEGVDDAGVRPRVLIVEDEQSLARVMARRIQRLGGQSRAATSLQSAITAFDEAPEWPDLLLLDLTLPDGRGLELFRHARAARPSLPVLAVSGFAEREDLLELARADAAFLAKPFGAAELEAAIHEVLPR